MIDNKLLELKSLPKNIAMMQTQPVKVTAGESSQPSISREEVFAKERTYTVLTLPGRIWFPASMIDAQIQIRQPVEVNLAQFPVDQLQMIKQQIAAELRDRELVTYKQNTQLRQQNAELITGFQTKAEELRQYEEREQDLSHVLQNIAL